jgi:hypothetical protein
VVVSRSGIGAIAVDCVGVDLREEEARDEKKEGPIEVGDDDEGVDEE